VIASRFVFSPKNSDPATFDFCNRIGCRPENICSVKGLRVLTRSRRVFCDDFIRTGHNREDHYHDERPNLGPEERVVLVILLALRREDRAGEADDQDERGKHALVVVNHLDAPRGGGVHAASHAHKFSKQDTEHREYEKMVQDRQDKIQIEHRQSPIFRVGITKCPQLNPNRQLSTRQFCRLRYSGRAANEIETAAHVNALADCRFLRRYHDAARFQARTPMIE